MTTSITSDRDYLEIYTDGDLTISSGSADSDADFPNSAFTDTNYGVSTITHSLGEIPLVRAYIDPAKNGKLYGSLSGSSTAALSRLNPFLTTISTTTTTKLIVNSNGSFTSIPVYYRIYRFGTKGVTSDERIDKIFDSDSDSATLAAAASSLTPITVTTHTVAHNQGVAVLGTLQFSEDQLTWYPGGSPIVGAFDTTTGPPGGPYSRFFYTSASISTDSTNSYIRYESNYTGSTKTIYTRWVLDYKI